MQELAAHRQRGGRTEVGRNSVRGRVVQADGDSGAGVLGRGADGAGPAEAERGGGPDGCGLARRAVARTPERR